MPISQERVKVLQMVEEGKLSPEDGARLLAALGQDDDTPGEEPAPAMQRTDVNGRHLRVRVSNVITGKQKVTVNVPLSIVDIGLRFVPANNKFDPAVLRDAIRNNISGQIVDVLDDEKGERVEVFID